MRLLGASLACGMFLFGSTGFASAEPPAVVVSIKPLHGLATALMEGVGEPDLLLDDTASPHGYSLRPSEARKLADADLVVWVGPSLESFLVQPLDSVAENATLVTGLDLPGMVLLEPREGGLWVGHDHDHHAEGEHHEDEHAHHEEHEEEAEHHDDEHALHEEHEEEAEHHDDEHAHHEEHEEEAGHHDDEHAHHEEHEEEAGHHDDEHAHHEEHDADVHVDPHVWLDPRNAQVLAAAIAEALIKADPSNSQLYENNLATLTASLEELDHTLAKQLEGVRQKPYIVFHDAYIYFEGRYGLSPVGSISVTPEQRPGARRIAEIRDLVQDRGALCIFAEPQFAPALVDTIAEGSDIGSGTLDPLGAGIDKGPTAYQEILGSLAKGLTDCLTVSG